MYLANIIFPAPAYVYAMGILAWPITIGLMLLEATIVWRINGKSLTFWQSTAHTLLANIISTAVGLIVIFTIKLPNGFTPGDEKWQRTDTWWLIAKISVVACFVLSFLIEGAFYRFIRIKPSITTPWKSALISNTASYGIILAFTLPH